ncbi:MAG: nucleotide exchange factor GrpE [Bacteroidetes bacterium]|nr:nucleotide exchange factor GrpE [Bacteroidota bacterium]
MKDKKGNISDNGKQQNGNPPYAAEAASDNPGLGSAGTGLPDETVSGSGPEIKEPAAEERLAEKTKQFDEINDKYLRLYAEFENFKKRTAKERIELILSAGEGIIRSILPVIDDMERAVNTGTDSEEGRAMQEGIRLILAKFKNILAAHGLQAMDTDDRIFNPDMHDAISHIPAPAPEQKGKIIDVTEKGYLLNGKVIRYAKVVVGS